MPDDFLTLSNLRRRYQERPEAVSEVLDNIIARLSGAGDPAVFISTAHPQSLKDAARELLDRAPDPAALPLWGIPFAVKDNIDVEGFETTAACPEFSYRPERDAEVVARLRAAGAIVVGKTNLDQFATGLNGTRSPYGAPRSVFDRRYISGGSSSGSAVAVAAGLVSFSLGTDTAGSGRVPAAFNNIVGIKPTFGALSARGLVPACRSLDCVSIFSLSVADGVAVRRIAEGYDPLDPFSAQISRRSFSTSPTLGVLAPDAREFFGDDDYGRLYQEAIDRLRSLGWSVVEFNYEPFSKIASLLYEGPWLAERTAAVGEFSASHPDAVDPCVASLLKKGSRFSAVDAFRAQYQFRDLKRLAEAELNRFDAMMLPTAPTTYAVDEMMADPMRLNARLGHYTNFVNFLRLAAIAAPSGFRGDGLPFGVTFISPAYTDDALASVAAAFHAASGCGFGPLKGAIPLEPISANATDRCSIAVVGAHLTGEPLNSQLVKLGGRCEETTLTAEDYRLFVLPNSQIAKPGLLRSPGFCGPGVEVEVWSLPQQGFGQFVADIPAPLGVGKVKLKSGAVVSGFLCEAYALAGAEDITNFGGWRAYLRSRSNAPRP